MIPRKQEGRLMRRVLPGSLMFLALLAGGSSFAAAQAPSDNGKQVAKGPAKTKPKKPAPASLSAAERATTRTIELPAAASSHANTPPADTSWTGFHIGVDGGLAK
jgi:hypothetical protein